MKAVSCLQWLIVMLNLDLIKQYYLYLIIDGYGKKYRQQLRPIVAS